MQDTETPTTKPQGRGKSSNSILSFDICLLYVVLRMQTCCSGVCRTYIFRCGFCDLINGNRNKTCCRPTRLTPARYSSTVYRGMRHCVSVRVGGGGGSGSNETTSYTTSEGELHDSVHSNSELATKPHNGDTPHNRIVARHLPSCGAPFSCKCDLRPGFVALSWCFGQVFDPLDFVTGCDNGSHDYIRVS